MVGVKRVAVIGAGPAGAIAVDALAQEQAFDLIRVFERREAAGGCWIGDESPPPLLSDLPRLADRSADPPVPVPDRLPAQTPKLAQQRFTDSSVYPYLETNVEALAMSFSQEPIPDDRTANSVALHGPDTPFRHWTVLRNYVQGLLNRRGYCDLVSYNTTVERVEKVGHEWKVTLRKDGTETDYWWVEWFDAVVVASGHYSVPYIPAIDGLEQFEKRRPGSVIHSKNFRGRDYYAGKRVVVVGASVSAADIAFDLTSVAQSPVHAVMEGHKINVYFGDEAFNHPRISRHPSITRVQNRTVYFADGTSVPDVDAIVFGTGYSWSLPFLPDVEVRNNRVPGLYQHVVYQEDPTLLFVGAVGAGLTFKIFEWQAVLAARLLAGRATLPPLAERRRWEEDWIAVRGDGAGFTLVFPDFEDYFETLRKLAGPPAGKGIGRPLPPFRREWFKAFMDGHERRKAMWRRLNAKAWEEEPAPVEVNGVANEAVNRNGLEREKLDDEPLGYDWETTKKLTILLQALQSLSTHK
ncbi:thiol-specific monooxygenase [Sodiomyces alkalinus F11]|uniref:Thiol-specific monooxygenase n=1 Tax=Sodiomyces alkalinus (strain CBS 110278 / VKM F-3762 / F11) TaxID=1314773 RepID=A0A3N2PMP3_SODAK|nr:thiol-specific monooxygenase [Sodiomyces alkalinus F11]ROT35795.1 thiol-specific monooxygenase [Sodiomyces alkalinus F11]